jgi:hypothetical protein
MPSILAGPVDHQTRQLEPLRDTAYLRPLSAFSFARRGGHPSVFATER